jgi:hypothetical protein
VKKGSLNILFIKIVVWKSDKKTILPRIKIII